jgi:hypothetical protein
MARLHQDNFGTNLTSNQTAGVTTTPLNSIPSIAAPFYIALDATNLNGKYEVVDVTSKTATNINHAATTYAHTTAEEVRMVVPAVELDSFVTSSGTDGALLVNAPQGFLINGKISVTYAAGITVAIKTLAGTDPSATDPVYCRIGDTVRTISAALSETAADGTNWFNAGSTELATKEVDYFVYLTWASNTSIGLGFARIVGSEYSQFSASGVNEKCFFTHAIMASTDYTECIGRFAATLSAGAGYTWSVPTYTAINLIQRPIYETRWLDILPTIAVSGGTVPTYTSSVYKYRVVYDRVHYTLNLRNSSGGTAGAGASVLTFQTPFDPLSTASDDSGGLGMGSCYENAGTISGTYIGRQSANKAYARQVSTVSSITGADQSDANRIFQAQGTFQF